MQNLKLKSYSDSGHGWIAIKRSILIQLGIADKISQYSYQSESGQTVYVEEDGDASKLVKALETQGVAYQFEHVRHNGQSRIRSLPRYENHMTLQNIRDALTFDDLKPAVKFLAQNMQRMAYGEFIAYKRTLESQAVKVGSNVKALNELAEQYQVFGYETV